MTPTQRVLILCTGNSCRSQMAEALWRDAAPQWEAVSAGSDPAGYVHPNAIKVLQERGLPVENLTSKHVDAFAGQSFDVVITVCDNAEQQCPHFAGAHRQLHWPFIDPAHFSGDDDAAMDHFRQVCDSIENAIRQYLRSGGAELNDPRDWNVAVREDSARLIRLALAEDLNEGADITSRATIDAATTAQAEIVARQTGIACGLKVAEMVVDQFAPDASFTPRVNDGDPIQPGQALGRFSGSAQQLLEIERTCLNFMGRLSGVSSLTARFVEACKTGSARLYDTRKTTPGWRRLEKYAVACGGGFNHRMGLFDAILIKDNHLAFARAQGGDETVGAAIDRARHWVREHADSLPHGTRTVVQIEVDNLDQCAQALKHQPDIILLDNMSCDMLREAVALRNGSPAWLGIELEASGGITLKTVGEVSQTGVDRISVGALTHSAAHLDLGLDWVRS